MAHGNPKSNPNPRAFSLLQYYWHSPTNGFDFDHHLIHHHVLGVFMCVTFELLKVSDVDFLVFLMSACTSLAVKVLGFAKSNMTH